MATIVGTSSAETLANNAGQSDTITGLGGHDTFVYARSGGNETDVMTDFGSTYFANVIDGTQAGVSTTASGTLTGALNRAHTAFSFSLSVTGLDLGGQTGSTADDVEAAHFHVGAPGVAGSIVFGFVGSPNNDTNGDTVVNAPAGTVTGKWDAGEGQATTLTVQIANLLAGDIYVNFHTPPHPSGEIRGQVLPVDDGLDKLDVTAANIGEFSTMQFLLHDVAGTAEFTTGLGGNTHTMRFQGMSEGLLTKHDFIFAGSVNETINGTVSEDDLFGAGGKDKIKGGNGFDDVFGEDGADILIGGGGRDMLFGGKNADIFTFTRVRDSLVGGGQRDLIGDFNQGQGDTIDLSGIDADRTQPNDQAFFLGGSAFTNTAGELIQFAGGGGITILAGDVDGDGSADFQIGFQGGPTLAIGDFAF